MNTSVARVLMMPAVLWLNANGAGYFRLRGTGSQRRPVPPRVRGNTRESRGWTDGRGIQGGAYTNAAFFLRVIYLRARNAWGFYCEPSRFFAHHLEHIADDTRWNHN